MPTVICQTPSFSGREISASYEQTMILAQK